MLSSIISQSRQSPSIPSQGLQFSTLFSLNDPAIQQTFAYIESNKDINPESTQISKLSVVGIPTFQPVTQRSESSEDVNETSNTNVAIQIIETSHGCRLESWFQQRVYFSPYNNDFLTRIASLQRNVIQFISTVAVLNNHTLLLHYTELPGVNQGNNDGLTSTSTLQTQPKTIMRCIRWFEHPEKAIVSCQAYNPQMDNQSGNGNARVIDAVTSKIVSYQQHLVQLYQDNHDLQIEMINASSSTPPRNGGTVSSHNDLLSPPANMLLSPQQHAADRTFSHFSSHSITSSSRETLAKIANNAAQLSQRNAITCIEPITTTYNALYDHSMLEAVESENQNSFGGSNVHDSLTEPSSDLSTSTIDMMNEFQRINRINDGAHSQIGCTTRPIPFTSHSTMTLDVLVPENQDDAFENVFCGHYFVVGCVDGSCYLLPLAWMLGTYDPTHIMNNTTTNSSNTTQLNDQQASTTDLASLYSPFSPLLPDVFCSVSRKSPVHLSLPHPPSLSSSSSSSSPMSSPPDCLSWSALSAMHPWYLIDDVLSPLLSHPLAPFQVVIGTCDDHIVSTIGMSGPLLDSFWYSPTNLLENDDSVSDSEPEQETEEYANGDIPTSNKNIVQTSPIPISSPKSSTSNDSGSKTTKYGPKQTRGQIVESFLTWTFHEFRLHKLFSVDIMKSATVAMAKSSTSLPSTSAATNGASLTSPSVTTAIPTPKQRLSTRHPDIQRHLREQLVLLSSFQRSDQQPNPGQDNQNEFSTKTINNVLFDSPDRYIDEIHQNQSNSCVVSSIFWISRYGEPFLIVTFGSNLILIVHLIHLKSFSIDLHDYLTSPIVRVELLHYDSNKRDTAPNNKPQQQQLQSVQQSLQSNHQHTSSATSLHTGHCQDCYAKMCKSLANLASSSSSVSSSLLPSPGSIQHSLQFFDPVHGELMTTVKSNQIIDEATQATGQLPSSSASGTLSQSDGPTPITISPQQLLLDHYRRQRRFEDFVRNSTNTVSVSQRRLVLPPSITCLSCLLLMAQREITTRLVLFLADGSSFSILLENKLQVNKSLCDLFAQIDSTTLRRGVRLLDSSIRDFGLFTTPSVLKRNATQPSISSTSNELTLYDVLPDIRHDVYLTCLKAKICGYFSPQVTSILDDQCLLIWSLGRQTVNMRYKLSESRRKYAESTADYDNFDFSPDDPDDISGTIDLIGPADKPLDTLTHSQSVNLEEQHLFDSLHSQTSVSVTSQPTMNGDSFQLSISQHQQVYLQKYCLSLPFDYVLFAQEYDNLLRGVSSRSSTDSSSSSSTTSSSSTALVDNNKMGNGKTLDHVLVDDSHQSSGNSMSKPIVPSQTQNNMTITLQQLFLLIQACYSMHFESILSTPFVTKVEEAPSPSSSASVPVGLASTSIPISSSTTSSTQLSDQSGEFRSPKNSFSTPKDGGQNNGSNTASALSTISTTTTTFPSVQTIPLLSQSIRFTPIVSLSFQRFSDNILPLSVQQSIMAQDTARAQLLASLDYVSEPIDKQSIQQRQQQQILTLFDLASCNTFIGTTKTTSRTQLDTARVLDAIISQLYPVSANAGISTIFQMPQVPILAPLLPKNLIQKVSTTASTASSSSSTAGAASQSTTKTTQNGPKPPVNKGQGAQPSQQPSQQHPSQQQQQQQPQQQHSFKLTVKQQNNASNTITNVQLLWPIYNTKWLDYNPENNSSGIQAGTRFVSAVVTSLFMLRFGSVFYTLLAEYYREIYQFNTSQRTSRFRRAVNIAQIETNQLQRPRSLNIPSRMLLQVGLSPQRGGIHTDAHAAVGGTESSPLSSATALIASLSTFSGTVAQSNYSNGSNLHTQSSNLSTSSSTLPSISASSSGNGLLSASSGTGNSSVWIDTSAFLHSMLVRPLTVGLTSRTIQRSFKRVISSQTTASWHDPIALLSQARFQPVEFNSNLLYTIAPTAQTNSVLVYAVPGTHFSLYESSSTAATTATNLTHRQQLDRLAHSTLAFYISTSSHTIEHPMSFVSSHIPISHRYFFHPVFTMAFQAPLSSSTQEMNCAEICHMFSTQNISNVIISSLLDSSTNSPTTSSASALSDDSTLQYTFPHRSFFTKALSSTSLHDSSYIIQNAAKAHQFLSASSFSTFTPIFIIGSSQSLHGMYHQPLSYHYQHILSLLLHHRDHDVTAQIRTWFPSYQPLSFISHLSLTLRPLTALPSALQRFSHTVVLATMQAMLFVDTKTFLHSLGKSITLRSPHEITTCDQMKSVMKLLHSGFAPESCITPCFLLLSRCESDTNAMEHLITAYRSLLSLSVIQHVIKATRASYRTKDEHVDNNRNDNEHDKINENDVSVPFEPFMSDMTALSRFIPNNIDECYLAAVTYEYNHVKNGIQLIVQTFTRPIITPQDAVLFFSQMWSQHTTFELLLRVIYVIRHSSLRLNPFFVVEQLFALTTPLVDALTTLSEQSPSPLLLETFISHPHRVLAFVLFQTIILDIVSICDHILQESLQYNQTMPDHHNFVIKAQSNKKSPHRSSNGSSGLVQAPTVTSAAATTSLPSPERLASYATGHCSSAILLSSLGFSPLAPVSFRPTAASNTRAAPPRSAQLYQSQENSSTMHFTPIPGPTTARWALLRLLAHRFHAQAITSVHLLDENSSTSRRVAHIFSSTSTPQPFQHDNAEPLNKVSQSFTTNDPLLAISNQDSTTAAVTSKLPPALSLKTLPWLPVTTEILGETITSQPPYTPIVQPSHLGVKSSSESASSSPLAIEQQSSHLLNDISIMNVFTACQQQLYSTPSLFLDSVPSASHSTAGSSISSTQSLLLAISPLPSDMLYSPRFSISSSIHILNDLFYITTGTATTSDVSSSSSPSSSASPSSSLRREMTQSFTITPYITLFVTLTLSLSSRCAFSLCNEFFVWSTVLLPLVQHVNIGQLHTALIHSITLQEEQMKYGSTTLSNVTTNAAAAFNRILSLHLPEFIASSALFDHTSSSSQLSSSLSRSTYPQTHVMAELFLLHQVANQSDIVQMFFSTVHLQHLYRITSMCYLIPRFHDKIARCVTLIVMFESNFAQMLSLSTSSSLDTTSSHHRHGSASSPSVTSLTAPNSILSQDDVIFIEPLIPTIFATGNAIFALITLEIMLMAPLLYKQLPSSTMLTVPGISSFSQKPLYMIMKTSRFDLSEYLHIICPTLPVGTMLDLQDYCAQVNNIASSSTGFQREASTLSSTPSGSTNTDASNTFSPSMPTTGTSPSPHGSIISKTSQFAPTMVTGLSTGSIYIPGYTNISSSSSSSSTTSCFDIIANVMHSQQQLSSSSLAYAQRYLLQYMSCEYSETNPLTVSHTLLANFFDFCAVSFTAVMSPQIFLHDSVHALSLTAPLSSSISNPTHIFHLRRSCLEKSILSLVNDLGPFIFFQTCTNVNPLAAQYSDAPCSYSSILTPDTQSAVLVLSTKLLLMFDQDRQEQHRIISINTARQFQENLQRRRRAAQRDSINTFLPGFTSLSAALNESTDGIDHEIEDIDTIDESNRDENDNFENSETDFTETQFFLVNTWLQALLFDRPTLFDFHYQFNNITRNFDNSTIQKIVREENKLLLPFDINAGVIVSESYSSTMSLWNSPLHQISSELHTNTSEIATHMSQAYDALSNWQLLFPMTSTSSNNNTSASTTRSELSVPTIGKSPFAPPSTASSFSPQALPPRSFPHLLPLFITTTALDLSCSRMGCVSFLYPRASSPAAMSLIPSSIVSPHLIHATWDKLALITMVKDHSSPHEVIAQIQQQQEHFLSSRAFFLALQHRTRYQQLTIAEQLKTQQQQSYPYTIRLTATLFLFVSNLVTLLPSLSTENLVNIILMLQPPATSVQAVVDSEQLIFNRLGDNATATTSAAAAATMAMNDSLRDNDEEDDDEYALHHDDQSNPVPLLLTDDQVKTVLSRTKFLATQDLLAQYQIIDDNIPVSLQSTQCTCQLTEFQHIPCIHSCCIAGVSDCLESDLNPGLCLAISTISPWLTCHHFIPTVTTVVSHQASANILSSLRTSSSSSSLLYNYLLVSHGQSLHSLVSIFIQAVMFYVLSQANQVDWDDSSDDNDSNNNNNNTTASNRSSQRRTMHSIDDVFHVPLYQIIPSLLINYFGCYSLSHVIQTCTMMSSRLLPWQYHAKRHFLSIHLLCAVLSSDPQAISQSMLSLDLWDIQHLCKQIARAQLTYRHELQLAQCKNNSIQPALHTLFEDLSYVIEESGYNEGSASDGSDWLLIECQSVLEDYFMIKRDHSLINDIDHSHIDTIYEELTQKLRHMCRHFVAGVNIFILADTSIYPGIYPSPLQPMNYFSMLTEFISPQFDAQNDVLSLLSYNTVLIAPTSDQHHHRHPHHHNHHSSPQDQPSFSSHLTSSLPKHFHATLSLLFSSLFSACALVTYWYRNLYISSQQNYIIPYLQTFWLQYPTLGYIGQETITFAEQCITTSCLVDFQLAPSIDTSNLSNTFFFHHHPFSQLRTFFESILNGVYPLLYPQQYVLNISTAFPTQSLSYESSIARLTSLASFSVFATIFVQYNLQALFDVYTHSLHVVQPSKGQQQNQTYQQQKQQNQHHRQISTFSSWTPQQEQQLTTSPPPLCLTQTPITTYNPLQHAKGSIDTTAIPLDFSVSIPRPSSSSNHHDIISDNASNSTNTIASNHLTFSTSMSSIHINSPLVVSFFQFAAAIDTPIKTFVSWFHSHLVMHSMIMTLARPQLPSIHLLRHLLRNISPTRQERHTFCSPWGSLVTSSNLSLDVEHSTHPSRMITNSLTLPVFEQSSQLVASDGHELPIDNGLSSNISSINNIDDDSPLDTFIPILSHDFPLTATTATTGTMSSDHHPPKHSLNNHHYTHHTATPYPVLSSHLFSSLVSLINSYYLVNGPSIVPFIQLSLSNADFTFLLQTQDHTHVSDIAAAIVATTSDPTLTRGITYDPKNTAVFGSNGITPLSRLNNIACIPRNVLFVPICQHVTLLSTYCKQLDGFLRIVAILIFKMIFRLTFGATRQGGLLQQLQIYPQYVSQSQQQHDTSRLAVTAEEQVAKSIHEQQQQQQQANTSTAEDFLPQINSSSSSSSSSITNPPPATPLPTPILLSSVIPPHPALHDLNDPETLLFLATYRDIEKLLPVIESSHVFKYVILPQIVHILQLPGNSQYQRTLIQSCLTFAFMFINELKYLCHLTLVQTSPSSSHLTTSSSTTSSVTTTTTSVASAMVSSSATSSSGGLTTTRLRSSISNRGGVGGVGGSFSSNEIGPSALNEKYTIHIDNPSQPTITLCQLHLYDLPLHCAHCMMTQLPSVLFILFQWSLAHLHQHIQQQR